MCGRAVLEPVTGGGRGSETERFLRSSSWTRQQQRTQWLRRIRPVFCRVFLLQLYHELWREGVYVCGGGWGIKARAVPMMAGFLGPFPPCAVNINTHFTVNTAAAGISGPGCPVALFYPLLVWWAPARPSDRHPRVFVWSGGCDACSEWTEPLAPQKSRLLGRKVKGDFIGI